MESDSRAAKSIFQLKEEAAQNGIEVSEVARARLRPYPLKQPAFYKLRRRSRDRWRRGRSEPLTRSVLFRFSFAGTGCTPEMAPT